MSAEKAIYLDSSAIVKLVVAEPESTALREHLAGRGPLVSSALARTEVARALLSLGPAVLRRGLQVLDRLELIRVSDRVLKAAAALAPTELRSLDAIHLATALALSSSLAEMVTYDGRMSAAGQSLGLVVVGPA